MFRNNLFVGTRICGRGVRKMAPEANLVTSHLSHTYHCDKDFFGTAEFYEVMAQGQRAPYSV